jgi:hypothetical protein
MEFAQNAVEWRSQWQRLESGRGHVFNGQHLPRIGGWRCDERCLKNLKQSISSMQTGKGRAFQTTAQKTPNSARGEAFIEIHSCARHFCKLSRAHALEIPMA